MIGDRERCLDAGMDDHITKPLRRTDLMTCISRLAGERARARQRAKHHAPGNRDYIMDTPMHAVAYN